MTSSEKIKRIKSILSVPEIGEDLMMKAIDAVVKETEHLD